MQNNVFLYLNSQNIAYKINSYTNMHLRGDFSILTMHLNDEINSYLNDRSISVQTIGLYTNYVLNDDEIESLKTGIQLNKVNKSVYIEYGSMNPTGMPHLGNFLVLSRGHFFTQLAKLFGFKVYTEYYVNDMGNQIDMAIQGGYELSRKYLNKDKDAFVHNLISDMKRYLMHFGIVFDNWLFESTLYPANNNWIEVMKDKVKYSSEDMPRKTYVTSSGLIKFLEKADFSPTYAQSDIHYLIHKKQQQFDQYWMFLGSDHALYRDFLLDLAQYLDINLKCIFSQMIKYENNSVITNFSKREGNVVYPEDKNLSMFEMKIMFLSYNNHREFILNDKLIEETRKITYKLLNINRSNFVREYILLAWRLKRILELSINSFETTEILRVVKELAEIGRNKGIDELDNFFNIFLETCIF